MSRPAITFANRNRPMPSPAREPCPSPVAYRHAFASRKAARRRPLRDRQPVEGSKLSAYLATKLPHRRHALQWLQISPCISTCVGGVFIERRCPYRTGPARSPGILPRPCPYDISAADLLAELRRIDCDAITCFAPSDARTAASGCKRRRGLAD